MEKKKEITVERPVNIAGLKLIPVSELFSYRADGKHGIAFTGTKRPLSIIIVSPSGKKAFHVTGEEVPIERLAAEIPALTDVLEEA